MKPLLDRNIGLPREISRWIKKQVEAALKQGVVLALDGSLNSALAAYLAVDGLGAENVLGLMFGKDECSRAEVVKKRLGIRTSSCDLFEVRNELLRSWPRAVEYVNAELHPRLRMLTLYHYAGLKDYLVLGASNKTEIQLGCLTRGGSDTVDLEPLGNLYQYEVETLARKVGVPPQIMNNKPGTAALNDEALVSLGYDELEYILECINKGEPCESAVESLEMVKRRVEQSQFKNSAPRIYFSRDADADEETITVFELKIIPKLYRVLLDGEPVEMAFQEFELLRFLASNPGKAFSRKELLEKVWGYDYFGGMRTVDVHIRRLRAKLEVKDRIFIETIRSIGYAFKGSQKTNQ